MRFPNALHQVAPQANGKSHLSNLAGKFTHRLKCVVVEIIFRSLETLVAAPSATVRGLGHHLFHPLPPGLATISDGVTTDRRNRTIQLIPTYTSVFLQDLHLPAVVHPW